MWETPTRLRKGYERLTRGWLTPRSQFRRFAPNIFGVPTPVSQMSVSTCVTAILSKPVFNGGLRARLYRSETTGVTSIALLPLLREEVVQPTTTGQFVARTCVVVVMCRDPAIGAPFSN